MNRYAVITLGISAVAFILPSYAQNFGSVTVKQVVSVYDADTFRVNIEGWPDIVGKNVPVRVKGIDAPEIRGKCANEKKLARLAKQFTVEQLRSAEEIRLTNIERGKYFRLLADVQVDGHSLAKRLLEANQVVPYVPGTHVEWCADEFK
ncbi:thermonuclease family protein [Enterovibrio calviensis]|uniref:thermonuclease family protein n=1 Tax=Enterovibrio calviensis TaxID=91359 RepID=UPI0037357A0C